MFILVHENKQLRNEGIQFNFGWLKDIKSISYSLDTLLKLLIKRKNHS